MALGRYDRGNGTPAALESGEYTPSQHALSFEGAGRFWKPKEERDSAWRFLKFKGPRSRALSNEETQNTAPSMLSPPLKPSHQPSTRASLQPSPQANIGDWLTAQSILDLPKTPDVDDLALDRRTDNESPVAKVESRDSVNVSISGSDSISMHTVSSTHSLTTGTPQHRFKSLAEKIADDERKRKTTNHLRRIMEAEDARIAQITSQDDVQELASELPKAEGILKNRHIPPGEPPGVEEVPAIDELTVYELKVDEELSKLAEEQPPDRSRTPVEELRLQNQSLPNALRLTFEPQVEKWNMAELIFGTNSEARRTSTGSQSDTALEVKDTQNAVRRNSTATASVNTITMAKDKKDSETTPPIPQMPIAQTIPSNSLPEEKSKSALSPRELTEAIAAIQPPRSPQKVQRASENFSKIVQSDPPSPPQSRPASTASQKSNRTQTPALTISPAPTPPPEVSPLPDTLFQDLNRLKMTSSRRQVAPRRPVENRSQSLPTGPPRKKGHSPSASLSSLSPPTPFTTFSSSPSVRPLSTGSVFSKALPPPPPVPTSPAANAVELSTSLSVVHRPKPPRADEMYRRVRQHSDNAVYNTLPAEPYPLLPPEPTFEAPPSEEELQDLVRAVSPRRSFERPGSAPNRDPDVNIEPDIDPRTGLPWLTRGPLNPFAAVGRKPFRLS